jgi:hypothetical protein
MLPDVVAVRLECPLAPLAGGDPRLKPCKPAVDHRREAQPRGHGQGAGFGRRDQQLSLAPGRVEVAGDGAEAGLARQHEADEVLAVGLAVDAPLDPDTAPLRRRLLRLRPEPRSRRADNDRGSYRELAVKRLEFRRDVGHCSPRAAGEVPLAWKAARARRRTRQLRVNVSESANPC